MFEYPTAGRAFEEFEYRLLYLRPTPYADERLAIGLLATRGESLEVRFVTSPSAIELMTEIFGVDAVEQYHFAAAEVRRALSQTTLDGFRLPSDLFASGEKLSAFTDDREGLLSNVLSSASCLVRSGLSKNVDTLSVSPTVHLQRDLFERVSRLNPFLGKRIFNQEFKADTGELVKLPILGDKIFGAPVSFVAKDQSLRAEAFVAKFHWLRNQMSQEPRLYLLVPRESERIASSRVDPSIRELRAIASALKVPVQLSESTEGMASQVLKDEAA